ncbi:SusD/RagB family nutrient-binding outer membrane lipoprotein [Pedobacter endophyticus]|uniref:SusD/RagB family nutrient-binding outer membrane lipoprotein n=1 Tax=Pedobacter endophyticus TaxID=2789740 RepID=A0A7U3Q409_9SPHI|nr:SusD/RagB family nutrient-binding outer membrane lipoprotein [Pedobacter endophyticus]QPH38142.1 SusD/RagB family nutrient-binding outer membrane lipoprotein [Pedobacter endophyticus]
MKKILNFLLMGAIAVGFSSCKKYLDINKNTNDATTATPALVLPQAIVGTAAVSQALNASYYTLGGFSANIYGVGGYGSTLTYAYTAGSFVTGFTASYDNANDYQYVIDNTAADPSLAYSTAIARIMKAYVFAKVVDQYNDVPYFEALKGSTMLTPKYDKAEDIYKDLISQLTTSIELITAAQASVATSNIVPSTDPLFKGDMNLWKKFANTIKLRLLIKMAGVPEQASYAATGFNGLNTSIGFLSTNALVNPGYVKANNSDGVSQQNPSYNSLAFNTSNVRSQSQSIPTRWIMTFYTGSKLSDPGRGDVIYRGFPSTAVNQLGEENTSSSQVPPAGFSAWFTGIDATSPGLGVAKGPSQGQSLMLAAESYFLQAEAYVRGYLTGDAEAAFKAGITASFDYLYQNQNNTVDPGKNVSSAVLAYQTANPGSYLVNYQLTAMPAIGDYNTDVLQRRIEAIITQKYIAMNMIHCDEAFNEFKRTTYPRIVNGSQDALLTFASKQSVSTRPDKLPGRVLYPQSEYNLNPANVPSVTLFGSKIFWDTKD